MKEIDELFKNIFNLNDAQLEILKSDEAIMNTISEKYLELVHENKSLKNLLAFMEASANAMPNPIFIKNEKLEFEFFNDKYLEFFGEHAKNYIGKKVTDLDYLSEEEREKFQKEDSQILEQQSVLQYEQSFSKDNELIETMYWSKGFTVPDTGEKGVIGEIVDISKEKRMQRELSRHSDILEQLMKRAQQTSKLDPATNVYNRQILAKELPEAIKNAQMSGIPICGMLTDIDNFKYINDNYGHPKGDEVLVKFTDILKGSVRCDDIIMRYGGDEFITILFGIPIKIAMEIAERFRHKIENNIILPQGEAVTISVGVCEYRCGEDIMSFLTRMDEGMYKAKKSGKNQVANF